MADTCSREGCSTRVRARGWCATHYSQWRRALGQPLVKTLEERWWAKVERTPTCWLWTAAQNGKGYGNFSYHGTVIGAHRAGYQILVGPIPDGLQLDHLCRNTLCVNPAHLEPVEPIENMRRGFSPSMVVQRSGRCHRGHELTPDNLYHRPDGKGSSCLICLRRRMRINNAKRKAS